MNESRFDNNNNNNIITSRLKGTGRKWKIVCESDALKV